MIRNLDYDYEHDYGHEHEVAIIIHKPSSLGERIAVLNRLFAAWADGN